MFRYKVKLGGVQAQKTINKGFTYITVSWDIEKS